MNLYRRFTAALVATLLLLCLIPAWAESPAEYDINAPQNLVAGHLFAESALLVDEDSGEVLFTKNSRVRMYPASTTKIMTLLLALESDIPLDGQVTIPPEAAQIPEGSSVIPVQPGDVMKFEDLLYGFMLSSGNDGANAIAVLVDGGIEPFVARMNARAQELGLEGTHYVNAHGYHDSEHYTTAQDLANLSRFAMQSEAFRRIVAAPKWTMSVQRGGQEVSLDIVSRNSLLQNDQKYYYPDCTGIKTGHHNKAGWCFVGSAERDGMRVICVVLNCAQENDKWYDAARLFEYGFTRYEDVPVSALLEQAKGTLAQANIENADPADPHGGGLALNIGDMANGDATVKVVAGSESAMSAAVDRVTAAAQIEWARALTAPVSAGEQLGTLSLALPDGTQVSASLTASRDVAAKPEVTQAPATQPPAQPQPEATNAPAETSNKRGWGTGIVIALIALLVVACVALAVAHMSARRRRAARRRRRKRTGTAKASSSQARNRRG